MVVVVGEKSQSCLLREAAEAASAAVAKAFEAGWRIIIYVHNTLNSIDDFRAFTHSSTSI